MLTLAQIRALSCMQSQLSSPPRLHFPGIKNKTLLLVTQIDKGNLSLLALSVRLS